MTKYEQETVINYNNESKTAEIYTCDPATMRKLEKLCEKQPDFYKLIKQDKHSKTFEFPKRLITLRQPKFLTDEQKEKIKQRFADLKQE
jgi:TusA-related sulfurtransferase